MLKGWPASKIAAFVGHMEMILPVELECEEHEAGKRADSPIDLGHQVSNFT